MHRQGKKADPLARFEAERALLQKEEDRKRAIEESLAKLLSQSEKQTALLQQILGTLKNKKADE